MKFKTTTDYIIKTMATYNYTDTVKVKLYIPVIQDNKTSFSLKDTNTFVMILDSTQLKPIV